MLAAFQQALADLVASPAACQELRRGPAVLARYDLTTLERERLVAMVSQREMEANCIIYRSNRLTPLVLNFPETCHLLGDRLREVLDRYWQECPTEQFVHFLLEARRFHDFVDLLLRSDAGGSWDPALAETLAREGAIVATRLAA